MYFAAVSRSFLFLPVCVCLFVGAGPSPGATTATNAAYGLFKGQGYWQYTETMTMADPNRGAFWECWVRPTQTGTPTTTIVRKPTGAAVSLAPDLEGERLLTPFYSLAQCDATFPAGLYRMTNQIAGSTRRVDLTLPSTGYPPAPMIVQFANLINPTAYQPLPLSWQPFSGAGANDFIQVILEDPAGEIVYHSPWPGQTGALSATTTHFTIPRAVCSATR